MTTTELTLTRPDDWHIHLRDDQALALTVPAVARYFGRAIVMPNLTPAITTVAAAIQYKTRILKRIPAGSNFEPLMTLYLTDTTSPKEIAQGFNESAIAACKLYPAGATTNSSQGVTRIEALSPALEAMQHLGVPLLIHGEVTDSEVDIFDREKYFIDQVLQPLTKRFPALKIVLEHITTADAAQFVEAGNEFVAATITPQHLLYDRNHMLVGGIRTHLYCLPILKRNCHKNELVRVATSGSAKFFLGSDSAPHAVSKKETACGCAGCYSGESVLELYAEVFEQQNALEHLEAFASHHGADFYGFPRNTDKIRLVKKTWDIPDSLNYLDETIKPLRGGETLNWSVEPSIFNA